MKTLFLLLVLYTIKDVTSQTKVPVLFVTEIDVVSAANEVNHFNLRLCGGCLYDKQIATVFVNQPNKPWSILVGDFVKVYVTDSSGHQIATNKNPKKTGDFEDTFSFPYYKTYGDLKITVVTANTPAGITYTLTVAFNKNQTLDHQSDCEARYFSTEEEIMSWKMFEKSVLFEREAGGLTVGKTYELVSVFLTTSTGSVETQQPLLFELDYCFTNDSLPASVVISVTAIDELSGFATYACPAHIRPCTTESTHFNDISGAAVNFVIADITQKEDIGPVQIIIRGDGRYGNENNFKLAASKLLHKIH